MFHRKVMEAYHWYLPLTILGAVSASVLLLFAKVGTIMAVLPILPIVLLLVGAIYVAFHTFIYPQLEWRRKVKRLRKLKL